MTDAADKQPEQDENNNGDTDMTQDEYSVTDEIVELNDRFQNNATYGGVSVNGIAGYHSLFNHDDGIGHAAPTALHAALDDVLVEIMLDPELIEQNHGEVTPETMAEELRLQLDDLTMMGPRFADRLCDRFEEELQGYEGDL